VPQHWVKREWRGSYCARSRSGISPAHRPGQRRVAPRERPSSSTPGAGTATGCRSSPSSSSSARSTGAR
jgi:hypothetical protein